MRGRSIAGFAVLFAWLLCALPESGRSEIAPIGPLPLLGTADSETILMGSAPGGEAGEAWGYRRLPLDVGDVRVGSRVLSFGPALDPSQPEPQLAFLRQTDASGWQVFDTPVDEAGQPYRGPFPNRRSARITSAGGGVLVGRDTSRPVGEQVVVLVHNPGGDWHAVEAPPPGVLLPQEGERPAEALADEQGLGAVALAAYDEGGRTALFFGPTGRSATDGIVRFDGSQWKREPIELPTGSEAHFHILALDATGLGNAWAIAEADESLGRSVVLLQRTSTAEGARVGDARRSAGTPFADRDRPAQGITGVEPVGGSAQPLTVTSDGVWIDLTASIEGIDRDITVYYAIGSGQVTGSWCDAPVCTGSLGVRFSRQAGYRSFAWAGNGFGTRVVTNPLDPGGGEESNRGTYLRFERRAASCACRVGAATSAPAAPLRPPTAAGSRDRSRSRRRPHPRACSPGPYRFAPR